MVAQSKKHIWQALALGSIAGMRSMAAPAFASNLLMHAAHTQINSRPIGFLGNAYVSQGLKLLAVTELLGDKLPKAPNRIEAGPLLARVLSGAMCGGFLYRSGGHNFAKGGLIGGLSAAVSSYVMYYVRKELGRRTGIADPLIGLAEDGLVICGGIVLLKNN